jgi:purine nucleosidase/non-specific riboncleoside hydrolase
MPSNRLIVDTDGGVDDAQALLLLVANGCVPEAVTTVFGNVSLHAATANVLATLAVAGAAVPVHSGASQPLAQTRIDALHVHGDDGLGGAPRPARTADVAGCDAVGFLVETLLEAAVLGQRIDLLTIGPLTNLALALQRDAGIAAGLGRVTVMGGTLFGRGNVTPAAEFNVFSDPEAAAIVFRGSLEVTLVPWETCLRHALAGHDLDRMLEATADSDYGAFVRALVDHERRRHVRGGRGDRLLLIDPLAAAVAAAPAIVRRSQRACLGIGTEPGLTRGMTVVDPSGRLGTPPAILVEAVGRGRLAALFAASLAYRPPARY